MSLNTSLVMVEGNHFEHIEKVLSPFKYAIAGSSEEREWDKALLAGNPYDCPRNITRKIAIFCTGWTVILDLEAVMWTDDAACRKVADALSAPVFAMVCNGVVGSYAFRYFDKDTTRTVWYDFENGFLDNAGKPLAHENGLHISKKVTDGDILKLMERLGVDYAALESIGKYQVFDLSFPKFVADASRSDAPETPDSGRSGKKPWWKIW